MNIRKASLIAILAVALGSQFSAAQEITVAAAAALVLYMGARRSWYFGNTAPLLCFLVLILLVMTGVPGSPWLWALPFLLTFVGGVFADTCEGPRGRLALGAAGAILLLQAVFCVVSLPGLL